jgi:hypothetical protein
MSNKKIPIEELDVFCDHLFRALDYAGLMPLYLGDPAHAYEKQSRLLVGFLTRYSGDAIEQAYDEWYTRAMRGMHQLQREKCYPYFEQVRIWLVENRTIFSGENRKSVLEALKRSLYGRIFRWLYPRRALAKAYQEAYKEQADMFTPEAVQLHFSTVAQQVQSLPESLRHDPVLLADAQAIFTSKINLYKPKTNQSQNQTP